VALRVVSLLVKGENEGRLKALLNVPTLSFILSLYVRREATEAQPALHRSAITLRGRVAFY